MLSTDLIFTVFLGLALFGEEVSTTFDFYDPDFQRITYGGYNPFTGPSHLSLGQPTVFYQPVASHGIPSASNAANLGSIPSIPEQPKVGVSPPKESQRLTQSRPSTNIPSKKNKPVNINIVATPISSHVQSGEETATPKEGDANRRKGGSVSIINEGEHEEQPFGEISVAHLSFYVPPKNIAGSKDMLSMTQQSPPYSSKDLLELEETIESNPLAQHDTPHFQHLLSEMFDHGPHQQFWELSTKEHPFALHPLGGFEHPEEAQEYDIGWGDELHQMHLYPDPEHLGHYTYEIGLPTKDEKHIQTMPTNSTYCLSRGHTCEQCLIDYQCYFCSETNACLPSAVFGIDTFTGKYCPTGSMYYYKSCKVKSFTVTFIIIVAVVFLVLTIIVLAWILLSKRRSRSKLYTKMKEKEKELIGSEDPHDSLYHP